MTASGAADALASAHPKICWHPDWSDHAPH